MVSQCNVSSYKNFRFQFDSEEGRAFLQACLATACERRHSEEQALAFCPLSGFEEVSLQARCLFQRNIVTFVRGIQFFKHIILVQLSLEFLKLKVLFVCIYIFFFFLFLSILRLSTLVCHLKAPFHLEVKN